MKILLFAPKISEKNFIHYVNPELLLNFFKYRYFLSHLPQTNF